MRRLAVRIGRQAHHVALGFRLATVGANWRSRLVLFLLAAGAGIKQNTRWRTSTVRADVRLAGTSFAVSFAGRTEMEVLREIAAGEYRLPAACRADVVLDLGAHIGLAALYIRAVRPEARIICVEADPGLIDQLRSNVEPHGIEVLHAAVAAEPGPVTFFVGAATWGNSLTRGDASQRPVKVPGRTYAEIAAWVEQPIGLLKIDVEGAEWEVFADGTGAEYIIGETHSRGAVSSVEALRPLEASMRVSIGRRGHERTVFLAEPVSA
jgi:FkbM family methyltransferase